MDYSFPKLVTNQIMYTLSWVVTTLSLSLHSPISWASDCNSLTVVGSDQWIPFAFLNKDDSEHIDQKYPKGIAYDVVRLIGSDLQLNLNFQVGQPWRRVEQKMNNGQVDLLAGNYWNEQRDKKWAISQSFSRDEVRVFTHKDNTFDFKDVSDLKKRHGLIPSGASFGQKFDQYKLKLDIKEVKDHKQILAMLSHRRTDYIVLPYLNTQRKIKQYGYQNQIVALEKPLSINQVHLSLSKQSPCYSDDLLNRINQAITNRKADGSIDAIVEAYL